MLRDAPLLRDESPAGDCSEPAFGPDTPTRMRRHISSRGTVALVGAGPGDPDLLTVRAARLLARADVVFVDALVDLRLLALCRTDARIVDVGKQSFGPATPQEDIDAMLIAEAMAGHFVVRLKGGDPFVFGRGGEEALALSAAGVPFEVVPGLSSALSVPALAHVPVTHRGVATSFTVLTGATATAPLAVQIERWQHAARAGGTLVFLMAVHAVERIAQALLEAGRAADTPLAFIENGATPQERIVLSTLERAGACAREARITAPAVIVVGEVVNVRAALRAAAPTSA